MKRISYQLGVKNGWASHQLILGIAVFGPVLRKLKLHGKFTLLPTWRILPDSQRLLCWTVLLKVELFAIFRLDLVWKRNMFEASPKQKGTIPYQLAWRVDHWNGAYVLSFFSNDWEEYGGQRLPLEHFQHFLYWIRWKNEPRLAPYKCQKHLHFAAVYFTYGVRSSHNHRSLAFLASQLRARFVRGANSAWLNSI